MAYAIDICHKEAADKGAAQQRVADTSSQRASSCTSAGTCDLSRNPFSGAGSATMRTIAVRSGPMAGAWAVGWALKSPIFWALAVALTAYWAVFSAFIFHAYPLLLERGFDTQAVVFAMAIIGPAQVAGRIAIWVFARGVQIRVIGSLVVLAFPLVFLGLMVTPPLFPAVALIAATYGAANGIMTIVRGLVVPEMLTPDAYGAINGALAVPTIVAKAAAPFGAALLWAASGSYVSVLIALLGGSLLLIIAFWVSALLAAHRDRTVSIP